MNLELQQKIFNDCSTIFRHKDKGPMHNLICFGIECGNGWFDLIYDLSVKLEKIVVEMSKSGDIKEEGLPFVVQIKEKFGGLRYYMSYETKEMNDLIFDTMEKAETVCELCGKPGEIRDDIGWVTTLCDEHHQAIVEKKTTLRDELKKQRG